MTVISIVFSFAVLFYFYFKFDL